MLTKYEVFLNIIDCGGVSSAAEKLGYSQPGVSHMLNSLENELGLSMLKRSKSGVRLTSEGETLLPLIRNVCDSQQELLRAVNEIKGIQTGLIRIGTFPSVAVNWLPGMIKRFHDDYPRVDFEILYGDYATVEAWILSGRVDCGFLRYPPKEGLQGILIGRDEMMAVLPEGHYLAERGTVSAELLENERFILLKEGPDNEFTEIFRELGITPKICFSAWDCQMITAMVEMGLGVSILPELTLRRTMHRIIKKKLDRRYFRKLGIVVQDMKSASKLLKTFLTYVKVDEVNSPAARSEAAGSFAEGQG